MKNFMIKSLLISLTALSLPASLYAGRGVDTQAPTPTAPSFPDTTPPSNSPEEETDIPSSGTDTPPAPAQGGGLVAQAQNAAHAVANHAADHPIPYAVGGAILGTGAIAAVGTGAYFAGKAISNKIKDKKEIKRGGAPGRQGTGLRPDEEEGRPNPGPKNPKNKGGAGVDEGNGKEKELEAERKLAEEAKRVVDERKLAEEAKRVVDERKKTGQAPPVAPQPVKNPGPENPENKGGADGDEGKEKEQDGKEKKPVATSSAATDKDMKAVETEDKGKEEKINNLLTKFRNFSAMKKVTLEKKLRELKVNEEEIIVIVNKKLERRDPLIKKKEKEKEEEAKRKEKEKSLQDKIKKGADTIDESLDKIKNSTPWVRPVFGQKEAALAPSTLRKPEAEEKGKEKETVTKKRELVPIEGSGLEEIKTGNKFQSLKDEPHYKEISAEIKKIKENHKEFFEDVKVKEVMDLYKVSLKTLPGFPYNDTIRIKQPDNLRGAEEKLEKIEKENKSKTWHGLWSSAPEGKAVPVQDLLNGMKVKYLLKLHAIKSDNPDTKQNELNKIELDIHSLKPSLFLDIKERQKKFKEDKKKGENEKSVRQSNKTPAEQLPSGQGGGASKLPSSTTMLTPSATQPVDRGPGNKPGQLASNQEGSLGEKKLTKQQAKQQAKQRFKNG